jgi:hypothetical protein
MFFPPNNILQHSLYSNIDKQTRLCLGTFEYTEADREIYRKWIKKSKQYCTILHMRVSDYFTYGIIIYTSLFITLLRYALHITEPHKRKKITYITWKVLWGLFDPKQK